MSEPFRSRGRAVPPPDRTYRTRRAVRIVVLAEGEIGPRVLMFNDRDPGTPGSSWWVLPGGGIDGEETAREAARRELAEEAGYVVDEGDLYGPVAVRVVLHGYSDQVTAQSEEIFVVTVDSEFEVDISGHTEFERRSVVGHAWRTVGDETEDLLWPADLARLVRLVRQPETWPVDLGTVEESVVPVALGHQGAAQTD
ncbi:MAG TPA: NUDIX domain-containing protein [Propionibacteriaceae bacterium]|nr:NUDIX domain-containing protein [Propionibacteriaceae bacterium]